MTLVPIGTTTPVAHLVDAVRGAGLESPTLLTIDEATSLRPGTPAPGGGAVVAHFGDLALARSWQEACDATEGSGGTTVVVEQVVWGSSALYSAGGRRSMDRYLKVVTFLAPRPGLSARDFALYWLGEHAELADRLIPQRLRGGVYVQNHALNDTQPHAGVAESYWEDLDALRAWSDWYGGEAAAALRTDEERFLDHDQRVIVVTTERTVSIDP